MKCLKNCVKCDNEFIARSGAQLKCDDCKRCKWCKKKLKYSHQKFCNNSCAGKWKYENSKEVRRVLVDGIYHPNRAIGVSRAKTGVPRYDMRGSNNPNWRGGTSKKRQKEMGRTKYKNWRRAIFERDNYTCVICDERSGKLEAHHIQSWKDFPNLRYDIDNGETVCEECHSLIHIKEGGLVG